MKRRVLRIKRVGRLDRSFFVCGTLCSAPVWASTGGTACRHFEQCPKSYTVLFCLLGLYLVWLAWDTYSSLCKRHDYLRDQKKEAQRKPKKCTKKQFSNQNESHFLAPKSDSNVSAERRIVAPKANHGGWLFVELLLVILWVTWPLFVH